MRLEAIVMIVICLVIGIILISIGLRIGGRERIRRLRAKKEGLERERLGSEGNYWEISRADDDLFMNLLGYYLLTGIGIIVILSGIGREIGGVINPEYRAVVNIIKEIKD